MLVFVRQCAGGVQVQGGEVHVAHASPCCRLHPMGSGHVGQWRDSADKAAGRFDSTTADALVHLSLSNLVFYSFLFHIWFLDWCRWTKFNGQTGVRNTHSEVEL